MFLKSLFSTLLIVAIASFSGSATANPDPTVTEGGVAMLLPDGQTVEAGSTIQVKVESNRPFIADSVMNMSEFAVLTDEQAPFEFDVEIPENLIGELNLSAMAKDADGNFAASNIIILSSQSSAKLVEIEVNPDSLWLGGAEHTQHLVITGLFNDGVRRNITDPATGTTYASSEPEVVTISADGILHPISNGFATIIITNGNIQDSIPVEVMGIQD